MHFLVTGGAGFIGSHLAERLMREHGAVTVLDNLSTGSLANLEPLFDQPGFEFVEGDVLDEKLVHRLVERCDVVVHLAAAVGVRYVLTHLLETLQTNVSGTANVLEAARRSRRKVLIASSSEVYGKNESKLLCETADSVLGPSSLGRWAYATTKKLDEFMAIAYATQHGVPVVTARFFNVVGPRQNDRYGMVLPCFVRAALSGAQIRVFGDGRQTRNFSFVADVVDALCRLLECKEAEGEIFNIGGTEEVPIGKLAEHVKAMAESRSPIVTVPYHQAYPETGFEDMRRRAPCLCKIRQMTAWQPVTPVRQMIQETLSWERRRLERVSTELLRNAG